MNKFDHKELMALLYLETDINDRRAAMAEFSSRVIVDPSTSQTLAEFRASGERYLNAVDRLCYCILHGLISLPNMRDEYLQCLENDIKFMPEFFGHETQFKNITSLVKRWRAEA